MPHEDTIQNVVNITSTRSGSTSAISFTRLRDTGDNEGDFQFTTEFYLLFAQGPDFLRIGNTNLFNKHTFKQVSMQKYTIPNCGEYYVL